MDGVLIDSEPFWRQAELDVLCPLGVPLTDDLCRTTTGMRIDRVVQYWFDRYPWPCDSAGGKGLSVQDVSDVIVDRVVALVAAEGEALPGAVAAIEHAVSLMSQPPVPGSPVSSPGLIAASPPEQDASTSVAVPRVAIATSSPLRLAVAVLRRIDAAHHFGLAPRGDVSSPAGQDAYVGGLRVISAEGLPHPKPHPEVYMKAAAVIGVPPQRCVAVEDSGPGVISALAAGMRVVAVPAEHDRTERRVNAATAVIPCLGAFPKALEGLCL
eukprot:TRINITY_DN73449_c0_g1_i1.p1 TRINITY_DN73449_c0_g1~~TRINITY_DN73449_c0_g1_i1.p1  ORF type:complete len:311 (+),score=42.17 TRINITY_DN73449_c0_g1_i1:127-933(+)